MISASSIKSSLIGCLKISLAFGLLFWMWQSGRIDFQKLTQVIDDRTLLCITLGTWLIAQLLGAMRWRLLLKGMGYNVTILRSFQMHFTGLFFNTTMPGAVGGDIIKATYIILDNKLMGKSPAMTSILIDRIIGLYGLFTIGGLVILANFGTILNNTSLYGIAAAISALVIGTGIFLVLITRTYRGSDPFHKLLSYKFPGFGLILKIYNSFRLFEKNPLVLVKAWIASVVIQGVMMAYFCALTFITINPNYETLKVALVFPLGSLASALPIAPGGLGVGHVAFDKLFRTVGYEGGATAFNIFILSNLSLNLLGVFGYLSLKKSKISKDEQKEPAREDVSYSVKL